MTPALLALLALGADTTQILPARFEGDLVRVVPETIEGKTLNLYTDTGGGLFLTSAAVKRLGLETETVSGPAGPDGKPAQRQLVDFPEFKMEAWIPSPPSARSKIGVMPAGMAEDQGFTEDGMLGESWFGGHVWTWDYPGKHLRLEGEDWKADASATRVPLGFRQDGGERVANFPRVAIRVDGEPIDMLLDTGAMTILTPKALKALGDSGPAERATSMIVDSRFKAWRAAHPDWRVIEDAQERSGAAMIEVPEVEIGGAKVGPVWFTWRPDANFREYMSRMMDQRVDGAIGGNALSHFVMTIDYPGATAYFRCVRDCKAIPRPAP
ncbi:MAG TPA: hypothetical protein VJ696_09015 [Rhodanobacteraceae bacterium]|nr:hypothetical protein [Rhodanobacteraceae bacterium]